MKPAEFEARLRQMECFHSLRLPAGAWTVVRVDGRGFSRLTEQRWEKPFDPRFHDCMVETARTLLEELQGVYAYTESDEISILFRPEWDLFDRELEKIVSVSAGLASAAFTHAAGVLAHFDSRVWLGADPELVTDYFRWRQADAGRCALNGWCYWTLRKAGRGVAEATQALEGAVPEAKRDLLLQHGVRFDELPAWQRRGTGLYWEEYRKEGFNPVRGERVFAARRRVRVHEELPTQDEYRRLLLELISPVPESAGGG